MTKRENYNEWMATYMLERYHTRRDKAIEILGGKCCSCGGTTKLEIDHKDPETKEIALNNRTVSSERYFAEIAKCQLLCKKCHTIKTITDRGNKVAKGTHGTLSSHRYCKCTLCKKAHSEYVKQWKLKKKNGGTHET